MESALNDEKNRLQKLLSLAFQRPVSRHQRSKVSRGQTRSSVTGLSHVNTVLSSHGDVSRILVAPIWIASKHPRAPDDHGGESKGVTSEVSPDGYPLKGSFFLFGIPISNSDLEPSMEGWLQPPASKLKDSGYWPADAFRNGPSMLSGGLQAFDLPGHLDRSDKATAQSKFGVGDAFDDYLKGAGEVAVVRMSRDFRKNLTDELVTRWLKWSLERKPARPLAFCDLSRAQAILLAEHLSNVIQDVSDDLNLPGILVLSEDLAARMCFLSRGRNNLYRFDRQEPPEASLVLQVIRSLRRLDSLEFWRRVGELKAPLLLRNVRWSGDGGVTDQLSLPTYLDYSLAVQNRELAKIIRRALRRVLSAFPGHCTIPIDDLIRPDLADATRWMVRRSSDTEVPPLFAISSVVTGSTITREASYRGDPDAVIACFLVDAIPPQLKSEERYCYYSALEWSPPIRSADLDTDYLWEREPGTPFVRPYICKGDDGTKRFQYVKPLARRIDERSGDASSLPSAAESYHEWHRDKLLKVGHWSIDRRHGLIEINHLNALQMSAVSAKGYYDWLAHELAERSDGISNPILVYPPGRLNAIMVRHLRKLRNAVGELRLRDSWQVVPINFLPDIGDGLKRLTPLTEVHINKCKDVIDAIVFFLDIGYVGNRTFRHTRRQLLDLGIKRVVGLGLLNRTSSPALSDELDAAEVNCYWRMDVPSLDDQRSCPICSGLKAMQALLERTRHFQAGASEYVKRVFENWDLSDPGQTWEEHGLSPLELTTPLKKKFGFKPPEPPPPLVPVVESSGQSSFLTDDDKVVSAPTAPVRWWPSNEVAWSHVWLRDSAQVVTYAMEIARTQAAPLYPLRLASQLAALENVTKTDYIGVSVAVEVITCYLLLCSHELSVATKEVAGIQLLGYLVRMEGVDTTGQYAYLKDRFARLRELVAVALISLDIDTKRLLLDEIVTILAKIRIVNPETRVAIMAAIFDPTDDRNNGEAGKLQFDAAVMERLRGSELVSTDTLRSNYWQLTTKEQPLSDQFRTALLFFGAGPQHGDCVNRLKAAESDRNLTTGWAGCRSALLFAHDIICRNRGTASSGATSGTVIGELFKALCGDGPFELDGIIRLSRQDDPPDQYLRAVKMAAQLIGQARTAFQGAMIRFEPASMSNSLAQLLKESLNK